MISYMTSKQPYIRYKIEFQAARLVSLESPLRVESTILPPIGPHNVRIEVHCAGINFYELMIMDGYYPVRPTLPTTLGGELAGKVLETGSKVTAFRKGDRVFSLAQTSKGITGSYAEQAQVDEKYLYHLPKGISFETGASIPMVTFAAHTMLRQRVTVPHNGIILIYNAAGGVGSALVQLAKALYPNITIIGTCSSEKKVKAIYSLGADLVIDTSKKSLAGQLRKKFPDGIDIIFDSMGQRYLDVNLSLLRPLHGTMCSYGTHTGPIVDPGLVAKLREKNVTLSGFLMWPLIENKKMCSNSFAEIFKILKTKKIIPVIDKIFPLKDINQAIRRIRQRKNIGKVLISTYRS